MKIRKVWSVLFSLFFLLQVCFLGGCSKKEITIMNNEGTAIASLTSIELEQTELKEEGYRAYLEIVLEEALQIISEEEKCSIDEAEEMLMKNQYSIYTAFDEKVYKAIEDAEKIEENVSLGCAITDLNGNLLAVYSGGNFEEGYQNFASLKTPPYSSFKPLSVYTPAIESGMVTWSTVYQDEPVKQVEDADGELRDWPANATGSYTNEPVSIYKAIKESLNTIAVRCLQEYGVAESIEYMKNTFGLSLPFEASRVQTLGEEESIGNIALGYLHEGVSPVEMAGYYQVFANGGRYTKPKAIQKICDLDGNVIYERNEEGKAVVSERTSYIMNQLLQKVVSPDGTGKKASCEGIQVGGKTGTGEQGNWFVGFTPQYSCAVWHGTEVETNSTAEIFSKVVSKLEHEATVTFPEANGIQQLIFCSESGMLISDKCRKVDVGYYSLDTELPVCDKHE